MILNGESLRSCMKYYYITKNLDIEAYITLNMVLYDQFLLMKRGDE